MSFSANDLLIKPVYDGAFYGEDKVIPLGVDNLALQSIAWSGINELISQAPTGADSFVEAYSRLLSDIDTLGILTEGDGVRFDRTYEWLSDTSSFVYKIVVTLAVALSVTAFSSGNHSVVSVRFLLTERLPDGTLVKTVADQTILTGMSNITSVEDNVAIVHFEQNAAFKISQRNKLRLQIIFNSDDSGTATTFEGIMPFYYSQEGSIAKTLIESAMLIHIQPALDSAFEVYRDQTSTQELDYDGVTRENIRRGMQALSTAQFPSDTTVSGLRPIAVTAEEEQKILDGRGILKTL